MTERVRVMRLIEYEGPREWVEETVGRAVHGTRLLHHAPLRIIRGRTIQEFPTTLATENETLMALSNCGIDIRCGACMEVAWTGATTHPHTCETWKLTPPPTVTPDE